MIQLSNQTISSFIELYFRKKGVRLTEEEANIKGLELIEFLKPIYKPIVNNGQNKKLTSV